MEDTADTAIFRLTSPFSDPLRHTLFSLIRRPVSRLLRLRTLNRLYARAVAPGPQADAGRDFVSRALDALGVARSVREEDLRRVPAEGPLVVVANHPFGAVEGLALIEALRTVRKDLKVMANFVLGLVPEVREHLILVDPFGAAGSRSRSLAGLKQAIRWLKDGHALAVFPAGEVASLKLSRLLVADPPWNPGVAGIVRKAGAPVLPVYFRGRNSNLFQAAGLVHPRLRTALLPREAIRRRKDRVDLTVGSPIPFEKLDAFASNEEMIGYLRFRTYLLRRRGPKTETGAAAARAGGRPIAPALPRDALAREIDSLPREAVLAASGDFRVLLADAARIPGVLREIGRLREVSFRGVGEGTGRALDLDRFDNIYSHLVLWNDAAKEVAGAYRFAATDAILPRHGQKGLYSSTLFDFKPGFLQRLPAALELGRSFVAPWHQRSYQPLMLLWKGLAAYIGRNPRHHTLFGCVSVSGDYDAASRELIVEFLSRHRPLPELSALVAAKRPPLQKALRRLDGAACPESVFRDPDDIFDLVGDVEGDKGVPVLLKQYLKLGGRLLGFCEDRQFGNCLDGLILVDLRRTEPRILSRFMGAEAAQAFLDFHRAGRGEPRAAA